MANNEWTAARVLEALRAKRGDSIGDRLRAAGATEEAVSGATAAYVEADVAGQMHHVGLRCPVTDSELKAMAAALNRAQASAEAKAHPEQCWHEATKDGTARCELPAGHEPTGRHVTRGGDVTWLDDHGCSGGTMGFRRCRCARCLYDRGEGPKPPPGLGATFATAKSAGISSGRPMLIRSPDITSGQVRRGMAEAEARAQCAKAHRGAVCQMRGDHDECRFYAGPGRDPVSASQLDAEVEPFGPKVRPFVIGDRVRVARWALTDFAGLTGDVVRVTSGPTCHVRFAGHDSLEPIGPGALELVPGVDPPIAPPAWANPEPKAAPADPYERHAVGVLDKAREEVYYLLGGRSRSRTRCRAEALQVAQADLAYAKRIATALGPAISVLEQAIAEHGRKAGG